MLQRKFGQVQAGCGRQVGQLQLHCLLQTPAHCADFSHWSDIMKKLLCTLVVSWIPFIQLAKCPHAGTHVPPGRE